MTSRHHIDTMLIHEGEASPAIEGAVTLPIFQTAMYETSGESDYHDVRYIRLNNTPNHNVLHKKLAALESAEAALVAASGMAAISTTLLTFLRPGDHVIAQNGLYGGTQILFVADFKDMGIEVDFVDGADPTSWESKLRPQTKVMYVETIANPTMWVGDLDAAVAFARAHGLVSMIDNTFATPVNYRPAEAGFDLSLHSGTKYLNGHNDIVAGAVIGDAEKIEKIRHKLNHLGGTLDPHTCFLLHRGLKTLSVRVRRQNENAMRIARFLEEHSAVTRVNYPGLVSNPHHERAKRFFDGFGGMLSFELTGGLDAAKRLLERASIPRIAPSLGGVESLLTLPATTSHVGMSREERESVGIADALVRMSVGIESADDLIDDLQGALES